MPGSRKTVQKIPVSCNKNCGAGCPLLAHVQEGRLLKVTNNPLANPYMTGCIRGFQMHRVVYAPDRLTSPLLRTGPRGSGEYKKVTWPEALDRVAEELTRIKMEYGPEAVLQLGESGSCRGALHNTALLTPRFLSLFDGFTRPLGDYSSQAVSFVSSFVFGTQDVGLDPGTLQFSNLIILWGANIVDTRFGSEMENRIREQKKRGVPVIVIDPRRSRTARRLGTQWIPVRPGTDTALMAAVLFVLIEEELVDREFVRLYSRGFKELESYILGLDEGRPKTPRWAQEICGTPALSILQFARLYGRLKPAALIPGLSIQRTMGGEEAARMTAALQVATGNAGRRGGSTGGNVWERLPEPLCGSLPVRAGPDQVGIPVYRWPDAVLEGKRGGFPSDIRAIYNVGGNYLCQGSDLNKNIKAFEKVEFSVCHDYFLTPTARYCDIVLPVTTFLEREDIVFPGINYLFYSNQALKPLPGVKNDYDIFCELSERLGFLPEFSQNRSAAEWLQGFLAESEIPDYEQFKQTGIYAGPDQLRVGLSGFIADPDNNPLPTPSGRIEISSAEYAKTGFEAAPRCRILKPDKIYPLRLISPHARYRIHSQNHNIPWFREREDRSLWLNPEDAAARNIEDGRQVIVRSAQGRMRILAHVTEDIMPGVVCLQQGAWPAFEADGTETAGSVNVLTSTVPTQPSQGARTHSVLVEVKGD